jgi:hypothetical protein
LAQSTKIAPYLEIILSGLFIIKLSNWPGGR